MSSLYIDWHVFEELKTKHVEIKITENDHEEITIEKSIKKFICEAPIGSGKSTAIRKWIYNTAPDNKFILIVPTINIAMEFYSKLYVALYNKYKDNVDDYIKVCIKEGAFKEFKAAITNFIPIVITTYSTASKCLGGIIESFYHNKLDINEYTLLIDEAHLLLENIPLIEIAREFDKVGLITATASDISSLSVFSDYVKINPIADITYSRTIYLHKLKNSMDEQRQIIAEQVVNESKYYDKILIKIEDKKECEELKKAINDEFKKAIYNADKKEVEISNEGKFANPDDVDIIIATSCIQAGQSLKENLLSIFIQTPLDTVSSVEQFIGRNRNPKSISHLYMRMIKVPEDKFKIKTAKNRYKMRLNQLRANAWLSSNKDSWINQLSKLGNVIVDDDEETNNKIVINDNDLSLEFRGKKQIYAHLQIKTEKQLPEGYMITQKRRSINGVRTKFYKLAKLEQK